MNNHNDEQQNEETYFVNRNIFKDGVSSDDSEYSRTGKLLWLFIPLLISFLIIAVIIALTQSFLMGIPATICCFFADVYIWRKMVFDENQFKRLIANNELNQEIGIANFNNVLNISADNQIFFQINKKGLGSSFLVTFDYASLTDESQNANVNVINDGLVPFIHELHNYGFDYNLYDIAIRSEISPGTLNIIRRTEKLRNDSWLKLIEMLKNTTIRNLEQNGSSKYRMYFEVINSKESNVANFKDILQNIINTTLKLQTSIVNPRICNLKEITDFCINYYQTSSFNFNERNVKDISIDKYVRFVSFFDNYGQNYSIDAFDPQFESPRQNSLFNMNKHSNDVINQSLKKNDNEKSRQKNEQSTTDRQQLKQQMMQEQKLAHQGVIKPNGRYDKSKQMKQKIEMQQKKEQEIKDKQVKMREENLKKKNTLTLNDLLNNHDN